MCFKITGIVSNDKHIPPEASELMVTSEYRLVTEYNNVQYNFDVVFGVSHQC